MLPAYERRYPMTDPADESRRLERLLLLLWFTPGSVLSEEGTGLVGD